MALTRDSIISKYDAQIDELVKRRGTTRKVPKYYTNRYTGKSRIIGYRDVPLTPGQIRNINGRIRSLKIQKRSELSYLRTRQYPSWAKRGWSASKFPRTSLSAYAQGRIDAKNAEAEHRRQSAL